MAGESDRRVKGIEGELSLLKNQIQQTLLDIREHVLEVTSPFSAARNATANWQPPAPQAAPQPATGAVTSPPPPAADPVQIPPEPQVEAVQDQAIPGMPALDSFDQLLEAPAAPELEPASSDDEDDWAEEEAKVQEPQPAPQPRTPNPAATRAPTPEAEQPPPMTSKYDLITLASLVRWVDDTTRKLGKERVLVLLDIYEMAGRMTPTTKQLVQRLCALSGERDERVPLREILSAMLQIDGVLEAKQADEHRLLGLLVDDTFDPFKQLLGGNGLH